LPSTPPTKPSPGIIVIHEIVGLNAGIQSVTRRLALAGYVALAVDLFRGSPLQRACIVGLIKTFLNTRQNGYIEDLRVAITHLSRHERVEGRPIGAVGFCLGGELAIALACDRPDELKVIAPFYGFNPLLKFGEDLSAITKMCPIVATYPTDDPLTRAQGQRLIKHLSTLPAWQELKDEALKAPPTGIPDPTKKEFNSKEYPASQHSFFIEGGPRYNAEAAEDAWQRLLAFFDRQFAASSATRPAAPTEAAPESGA
jgi:carboxymethylenebutenolidase